MTPEEIAALDAARALVAAGVPVFVARPDPAGKGTGFRFPPEWQHTAPDPAVVERWRPGMALCAVMGQGLDLVDVDPRNGGTLDALNGALPTVYASAATPSGGVHAFVRSLGAGSHDGVLPGIDVKGGDPDGESRGCAFLAPTVRRSKTTGQPVAYRWLQPPTPAALAGLAHDQPGAALAELVRAAGLRAPQPSGATAASPLDGLAELVANGIPDGEPHDHTLAQLAWNLRAANVPREAAYGIWSAVVAQTPPGRPEDPFDEASFARHWKGADAKIGADEAAWAALLPAGVALPRPSDPVAPPAPVATPPDDPFELQVAAELGRLQIRSEAQRRFRADARPRQPLTALGGLLADLNARPEPEERWRVERLLAADGRLLLSAQKKTGKTTTVVNLCRALLTGEPFLGRFPVTRLDGRVVFLNYEVTERQARRWLNEAGVPAGGLHLLSLRGQLNPLADEEGRAELAELIRTNDGQVLVVDPFAEAFTGESENDAADVRRFLRALNELAEAAGVAELVLTAHAGWNGERSRGSTALEDWPDAVVTLTKDETGNRYLRAEGRDVDIPEDALHFDPQGRRLTVSGEGSRAQSAARGAGAAIEELLRDAPGLSGREIEARIGTAVPRAALREALRTGVAAGWIVTAPGERGAVLHSLNPASAPVRRSAPANWRGSAPAPIYGAHTRTDPPGALQAERGALPDDLTALLDRVAGPSQVASS